VVFLLLFVPFGEAGSGHSFAESAVFEEVLFQAADLLIEQVVGYFDQADDHVGGDFGVRVLDAFAEGFVCRVGLAVKVAKALRV